MSKLQRCVPPGGVEPPKILKPVVNPLFALIRLARYRRLLENAMLRFTTWAWLKQIVPKQSSYLIIPTKNLINRLVIYLSVDVMSGVCGGGVSAWMGTGV